MGILIAAVALAAAQAAPSSGEHRLTPEQIEAVLAEAAAKREASEKQALATIEIADVEPLRPPPVHGEFGIGMGTGGYREIFGSSIIPMGTNGGAALSFDFVDFGNRDIRRDRY
jgi:hypothetical protein